MANSKDSPFQQRRGPGRPPGSKNRPKGPPAEGHGELRDEPSGGSPAHPVEVRTICGMEFSTRRNGDFPPMVVRKIALAHRARGISERDIVERMNSMGIKMGRNRIYGWRENAGQPNAEQIAALAEVLDVSADYLIDDSLPELADPPRQRQARARDPFPMLANYGLNLMDLERYLRVIATAKDLDIDPQRAVKALISVEFERLQYLKSQDRAQPVHPDDAFDHRNERDNDKETQNRSKLGG